MSKILLQRLKRGEEARAPAEVGRGWVTPSSSHCAALQEPTPTSRRYRPSPGVRRQVFLTLPEQLAPPHLHVPFPGQPPGAVPGFQLWSERIASFLLCVVGGERKPGKPPPFFPLVSWGGGESQPAFPCETRWCTVRCFPWTRCPSRSPAPQLPCPSPRIPQEPASCWRCLSP